MLIRGGYVIDGTNSAPVRADVRIDGARIAEVGANLKAASSEEVVDAGGAFVSPGFIDCHTHFDAPMFWSPTLDPLPGYGATTVMMGNCGFSVAPMPDTPASRQDIIDVFSYIEDIPKNTFRNEVPWDWSSWPEYRAKVSGFKTAGNLGALVGHLNLRIVAMGPYAWTRAATESEIQHMAQLLDESLKAGAFGFSTNLQNVDNIGRPLPTLLSQDREFEALLDVLARYQGRVLQFNNVEELEPAMDSTQRMARLCKPRNVRMQYLRIPTELRRRPEYEAHHALYTRLLDEGVDIWPAFTHRPPAIAMALDSCILFGFISLGGFHELSNQTPRDQKAALLANPEWRARIRKEWDGGLPYGDFMLRGADRWLFKNSDNGKGPVNVTLTGLVERSGKHPMDAVADWWLDNGIDSTIHIAEEDMDVPGIVDLIRDPRGIGGVNDAAAHSQMFCGGGDLALLFKRFVRPGHVRIEEIVHLLTGRLANHYGLKDRGVLKPGAIADVTIFMLEEMDQHDEEKIFDVPDGAGGTSWRFTRKPAPVRATIVNGQTVFDGKTYTGALPGALIGV
jgi:N-acyl-D-amino-acid deacylase